jgi:hypothetical protein
MSQAAQWALPKPDELSATLTSLFASKALLAGSLTVTSRRSIGRGSFPKEIVTCHLSDGQTMRVFCKYEAGFNHDAHGHRGGVAHEAMVYQRLLPKLEVSTPTLYGVYRDAARGGLWLVLESLEDITHLHKVPEAMGSAARWIGRFHAAGQDFLQASATPFLDAYDEDYFLGWAKRTRQYLRSRNQHTPWLEQLCTGFREPVSALLSVPPTVVHGEYYPENILVREGTIYPVDWESTVLAAGEIDLASLTEGWPEQVAQDCESEYQITRWPGGTPDGFFRRLWTARLYLQFRWLGDDPERDVSEWRLEALHSAGERLGLL